MIVTRHTHRLQTLEQILAFVEGSESPVIEVLDRGAAYDFVTETLRRVGYSRLGKADKGGDPALSGPCGRALTPAGDAPDRPVPRDLRPCATAAGPRLGPLAQLDRRRGTLPVRPVRAPRAQGIGHRTAPATALRGRTPAHPRRPGAPAHHQAPSQSVAAQRAPQGTIPRCVPALPHRTRGRSHGPQGPSATRSAPGQRGHARPDAGGDCLRTNETGCDAEQLWRPDI